MKEIIKNLKEWWWWHGYMLCSWCYRPFKIHAFLNPMGLNRGKLVCSFACCAKASHMTEEELEKEVYGTR